MLHRALIQVVGHCEALDAEVLAPDADPAPAGDGDWVRTDRLAARIEPLIAGESARITARHGTAPRPHVAATRLLHHYLWSSTLLLSGCWYLSGLVPRPDPADLWIKTSTGRLAIRPGRWSAGGGSELRDAVAEHVGPALAAFRPHVRRGPRALWGMAADDLVSGIWHLGRVLGEEERAVRAATAVLPGGTPPFPGAADFRLLSGGEDREHWTRTRLGCCLYYAIEPAAACLTCPRTSDAERLRRLEATVTV